MPTPTAGETEKDFVARCIPMVMNDGSASDNEQAAAVCYSMWQKHTEGKSAHDYSVQLGAMCDAAAQGGDVMGGPKSTEPVISFGGEVKALPDGHYGGYLITFTGPDDPDLTGDYFDAATDFGIGSGAKTPVYFNHRLPLRTADGRLIAYRDAIGEAMLTIDTKGVLLDAIVHNRNQYEADINVAGKLLKLGWSSGTASHLVDREPAGKAQHILKWPLGLDASMTPQQAEPYNAVIPLKIYLGTLQQAAPDGASPAAPAPDGAPPAAAPDSIKSAKEPIMDDELKSALGALTEKVTALEAKINAPPVASGGHVTIVPEDKNPFKRGGDQLLAIRRAALSPGDTDPRLLKLNARYDAEIKALGANEGIGSEGGFLLQETDTNEVLMPMRSGETSPFVSRARKLPVGPNSISGHLNAVDETDRATGSRWGGIRGYRLGEGGTLTKSKPAFRRINWELHKYGVLFYATDELVRDATQLQAVWQQGLTEELTFMANDDVLNGLGAGGPLGILNAGATVSVGKEDGQAAATVVYQNLVKMWQRVHPRSRANAVWFINSEVEPQLDQLSLPAGVGALEPRYVTYGSDGVMRIKGKPVVVTEFNAAVGTVGDIVVLDLSEYLFWDTQIEQASSIHVAFLTDEMVFRAIYSCEGQPTLLSPITPYKGSLTQSPFVSLATRA